MKNDMNDPYGYFTTKLLRHYYSGTEKSFIFPKDTYENWVLLIPEKGEFQYMIREVWENVHQGQIVLCPPGIPLHRRSESNLVFHFYEFVWYDSDGIPFREAKHLPYGKLNIMNAGRLSSSLQLLASTNNPTVIPGAAEYRNHLLDDILHLCLKEAFQAKFGSSIMDEQIKEAAEYIRRNAGQEISMKMIAHHTGLSPSQFTRRFQSAMGTSPLIWLTSIRMQMAKTLLLETELTLEQIAERCGYQNGFYFSRVFRKQTQITPSEFRRTHRF